MATKETEDIADMMIRLAVEELAKLEHEQWAHWMMYLKEKGVRDGALVTYTMEQWAEWMRKAATPYKELTEKEKESDREWAKKVLMTLGLTEKEVMKALIRAQIKPLES